MHRAVAESMELAGRPVRCAVLEDGSRVVSPTALGEAFGRDDKTAAFGGGDDPPQVARFLAADNLKPFVAADLVNLHKSPIEYIPLIGKGRAYGLPVEVIPLACDAIIGAALEGKLRSTQRDLLQPARELQKAAAEKGWRALVDEATGFRPEVLVAQQQALVAQEQVQQAFWRVCQQQALMANMYTSMVQGQPLPWRDPARPFQGAPPPREPAAPPADGRRWAPLPPPEPEPPKKRGKPQGALEKAIVRELADGPRHGKDVAYALKRTFSGDEVRRALNQMEGRVVTRQGGPFATAGAWQLLPTDGGAK